MQLTDFFAPFNVVNIFLSIFVFLTWDATGFLIAKKMSFPDYLRPVFWVFGVGFFVFIWFLLHFFLPFSPTYVRITIIIAAIVVSPFYVHHKGLQTLIQFFIKFPWPALFLLLVARNIFFDLSAPPTAWDEMAYHFLSPAQVLYDRTWVFPSGLYEMVPRFLETSYVLAFSAVKTHIAERLVHFLLYFLGIYSASAFLKKYVSTLAAVLFAFGALFINVGLLQASMTGYIDAGAAVLVLLFLLTAIGFFYTQEKGFLWAAAALLALSLGTKYTTIGFCGAVVAVVGIAYILSHLSVWSRKIRTKKIPSKWVFQITLATLCVFVVFGGFWYIKNFIYTGDPLYPFLFPCWKGIPCQQYSQSFFTGWTTPLTLENLPKIEDEVFQHNAVLFQAVIVSLILGLVLPILHRKPIPFLITLFTPIIVCVEILVSQHVSGFLPRYFYHWYLLIPLVLALPWVRPKRVSPFILAGLLVVFTYFGIITFAGAGTTAQSQIIVFNDPHATQDDTQSFARQRIPLSDWIQNRFPAMNEIITWCNQPKKEPVILAIVDPQLIWSSFEGLMRVYMVNCKFTVIPMPQYQDAEHTIEYLKAHHAYLAALEQCNGPKTPNPYNDPQGTEHWHYATNQELTCNLPKVMPHLYRFDPE